VKIKLSTNNMQTYAGILRAGYRFSLGLNPETP